MRTMSLKGMHNKLADAHMAHSVPSMLADTWKDF